MQISRIDIQQQINSVLESNPDMTFIQLRSEIRTWLDTKDLTYENLTHEFIRDHILEDLNSYEGVPD